MTHAFFDPKFAICPIVYGVMAATPRFLAQPHEFEQENWIFAAEGDFLPGRECTHFCYSLLTGGYTPGTLPGHSIYMIIKNKIVKNGECPSVPTKNTWSI